MSRRFHFVAVSNPAEIPSSEYRKSVYSHAFRQAHAKRRREQTERYNIHKARTRMTDINDSLLPQSIPLFPLIRVLDSNRDPFGSLARPLTSIEYLLLDHYIHVIIPFTVGHCGLFDGYEEGDSQSQLLRQWISLAVADEALMMAAILLGTCRYILRVQPDNPVFVDLALQYKLFCLRMLRWEISDTSFPAGVLTVAKALALAIDEVDYVEQSIARQHLKGILAIVQSGGGIRRLGVTGLLERMYNRFIQVFEIQEL